MGKDLLYMQKNLVCKEMGLTLVFKAKGLVYKGPRGRI